MTCYRHDRSLFIVVLVVDDLYLIVLLIISPD
jgi:hypothetical protein